MRYNAQAVAAANAAFAAAQQQAAQDHAAAMAAAAAAAAAVPQPIVNNANPQIGIVGNAPNPAIANRSSLRFQRQRLDVLS